MPTPVFPKTWASGFTGWQDDIHKEDRWEDILHITQSGRRQHRQTRDDSEFFIAGTWETDSPVDLRTLHTFWKSVKGRTVPFYFFYPDFTEYWVDISIGTGDGSEDTFTIPGDNVTNDVIKVAGTTKTSGVHYNLSAGTGTYGQDQAIFTVGNEPGVGEAVTAGGNWGYLYLVEFYGTAFPDGYKENTLHLIPLKFVQVYT